MPIHDHKPAFLGRAFFWGGIGLGLLLVAALLTHGFGLLGGPAKPESGPAPLTHQGDKIVIPEGSPLRSRIAVAPAKADAVAVKLLLPGAIEADPARSATVLPQLSGRIVGLKVRLGDRVSKNQALAVLESADLAQAYADYDKANDAVTLTRKNLGRQQEQARIGVASDKDLDQAKSDNVQAEAEYDRTRRRLGVLNAPLETRGSGRLLTVRAPVGGSVTALNVTPDSVINDPTQPLMTLADLSTVWATALVPEKDLAAVAKGQEAEVALIAYPDHPLRGTVLFIGDLVETDTRRARMRIALPNPDYALKPNMFATVTLIGRARPQVILPSSSLLMNNDRTSVFVATAPWTFERRTVEPQLEEGESIAIRSGVAPGEQVVVKGGILLND